MIVQSSEKWRLHPFFSVNECVWWFFCFLCPEVYIVTHDSKPGLPEVGGADKDLIDMDYETNSSTSIILERYSFLLPSNRSKQISYNKFKNKQHCKHKTQPDNGSPQQMGKLSITSTVFAAVKFEIVSI